MTRPVTLALRSASVAITVYLMALGTTLAHAGEAHAEPSDGGWSAVGWYGVAAVVVVGATVWLLTRARPEEPAASFPAAGPIGKIADDRVPPPA